MDSDRAREADRTSVSIDTRLLRDVDEQAAASGQSRESLIDRAIGSYLEELEAPMVVASVKQYRQEQRTAESGQSAAL